MQAIEWRGIGDYDCLLTLSEEEMRDLAARYGVDWSFFTEGPAKSFDDKYFCFVSYSRKALALLPFLSLAFGGMYDELPLGDKAYPVEIDFSGYTMEEFSFKD